MGRISERRQRKVLGVDENQGRNTFGWIFVLLVFGGLTMFAMSAGEPAAFVAGAVAVLAGVRILHRVSRSAHARTVVRASHAPGRGGHATPQTSTTSQIPVEHIPELKIQFLQPGKFPVMPKRPRRIKEARNVIGRPPLNIVYLRMFANPARARTFLESAWREFGYVHLLRDASSVTPREYRKARTGLFFVEDDTGFAHELRSATNTPLRPGRHRLDGVAPKSVKVRDPFGAYPLCAVACRADYWRRAVDLLLRRANLVVLDLSGFTSRNAGTAYELQRVIDLVPIERVILICDPKSDRRFLQSTIESSWSQMSGRSPNASGGGRRVRCGITDRFRTQAVRQGNQVGGWEELRSNRKESRRLAAAAQLAADAAPPRADG